MVKGGKNKVPDGWADYTNMGRQIPGTRFFAMKVPLCETLLAKLSPSVSPFDTRVLMDHCSALGLVIDLTNTDRYYDPKDFTSQGILHQKIETKGHVLPNVKVVKRFFRVVEEFLEKNVSNEKLIGIHCTHGLNRTGYLICRYMIQLIGVAPDQAISDFNSARGHEMERQNYLNHLRSQPWLQTTPLSTRKALLNRHKALINKSDSAGDTPPYMPQRSRRGTYQWADSQQDEANANSAGSVSRSHSRPRGSADEGWSPCGLNGPPQSWRRSRSRGGESPAEGGPRGAKRSASSSFADDDDESPASASDRGFKSPKFGREYYERYFHGNVLPQYDADFYSRGGGGVGPHRPPPRALPPTRGHPTRPKQYRGPQPYRSPPPSEEPSYGAQTPRTRQHILFSPDGESFFHKDTAGTPKLAPVQGPSRNILSPGAAADAFSPDNEFGRRRSQRFQPY